MKKFAYFFSLIVIISACLFTGCSKSESIKVAAMPSNSVGELTIFALDNASKDSLPLLFNLGHSYLTFKNTTLAPIKIGNYSVSPNETICFGTWSISSHFGVWYNLESNYHETSNRYEGCVSVTKGITASDIEKVNEFIYSHNYWNPLKNCSYFALNLWNTVASKTEQLKKPLIYTPKKVANQIRQFATFETNKHVKTNNNFGYFNDVEYVSFTMEGDYEFV